MLAARLSVRSAASGGGWWPARRRSTRRFRYRARRHKDWRRRRRPILSSTRTGFDPGHRGFVSARRGCSSRWSKKRNGNDARGILATYGKQVGPWAVDADAVRDVQLRAQQDGPLQPGGEVDDVGARVRVGGHDGIPERAGAAVEKIDNHECAWKTAIFQHIQIKSEPSPPGLLGAVRTTGADPPWTRFPPAEQKKGVSVCDILTGEGPGAQCARSLWTPEGDVPYSTKIHATLPNTQLVRLGRAF